MPIRQDVDDFSGRTTGPCGGTNESTKELLEDESPMRSKALKREKEEEEDDWVIDEDGAVQKSLR